MGLSPSPFADSLPLPSVWRAWKPLRSLKTAVLPKLCASLIGLHNTVRLMSEQDTIGQPARLNVSQAAKTVGKARSTLNRDIDTGKVSVTRNGKGQPFIEIAELERVYGRVDIRTLAAPVPFGQPETAEKSDGAAANEVETFRERLSTFEQERDRERVQLMERIADLRQERDRLLKVIEEQAGSVRLLTDQREDRERKRRRWWWRRKGKEERAS